MNWKKVKLGEICQNLDGKRKPLNNIERQKIRGNGKYPYFGANNIMDWVDEYIFDEKILCIAEDGGSWGAGQNCCFIYAGKCWVNNHAHVLKAKEGVSTEFLMYYLNFSDLNSYITGSTRGKLTKSSLDGIKIPLPDLATQKHIAEVLDKADALRQQNRQLLAHYDELLQSTFIELFGDPVKNPKGWEVRKLGEVIDITSGLVNPQELPYNDMLHVGGDNIESNTGKLFGMKKAHELNFKSGKYYFDDSCILYNKIRPNLNKVSRPSFEGICSADMYPIKGIGMNNVFLWSILISQDFVSYATNASRRANIPKINREELCQYQTISPPLPLQQHFAKIVEQIEAQKAQAQTALTESEALFEGLLAGYFG